MKHIFSIVLCLVEAVWLILTPLSTVHAATDRRFEIGISAGSSLLHMTPRALAKRFADMKQLGASWVRLDFSWAVLQPHDAKHFDYSYHDRVVIAAEKAGIKVLGIFIYTPRWARTEACKRFGGSEINQQKCAPRSAHEFALFTKQVAYHYRNHNVWGWEIWNEPNLTGFWKQYDTKGRYMIDPVAYGKLATRVGNAIHAVDHNVTVITGGLAPMFQPSATTGMRQSDFLSLMLPFLARGGVNAIGIHPYTSPALPSKAADWNAFYTVNHGGMKYNLQAIIGQAHRTDLHLWATEFGASTTGTVPLGTKPSPQLRPDHVSENQQARIIAEGIQQWFMLPNVGPIFIYSDSDIYLPQHKNQGGFGLRHLSGTPKPAYSAARQSFTELKAAAAR